MNVIVVKISAEEEGRALHLTSHPLQIPQMTSLVALSRHSDSSFHDSDTDPQDFGDVYSPPRFCKIDRRDRKSKATRQRSKRERNDTRDEVDFYLSSEIQPKATATSMGREHVLDGRRLLSSFPIAVEANSFEDEYDFNEIARLENREKRRMKKEKAKLEERTYKEGKKRSSALQWSAFVATNVKRQRVTAPKTKPTEPFASPVATPIPITPVVQLNKQLNTMLVPFVQDMHVQTNPVSSLQLVPNGRTLPSQRSPQEEKEQVEKVDTMSGLISSNDTMCGLISPNGTNDRNSDTSKSKRGASSVHCVTETETKMEKLERVKEREKESENKKNSNHEEEDSNNHRDERGFEDSSSSCSRFELDMSQFANEPSSENSQRQEQRSDDGLHWEELSTMDDDHEKGQVKKRTLLSVPSEVDAVDQFDSMFEEYLF
jgi:hypothetical protein